MADGVYWRFKLKGEWLHRHITLTESLGAALNTCMFARRFCNDISVLEVDETARIAAVCWKAHAAQVQLIQDCLANIPDYAELADSLWVRHVEGWGDGLDMPGMRRLAAAFGISLREVQHGPDELSFLADVLEKTRE